MLNRPQNAYSAAPESDAADWDFDGSPARRCVWLWVMMALPLVGIAGRLAWVQSLTDEYLAAFDVTTESFEPIAARDGRILSADGRVLADDLQQFDIHVHYRWVETPANPAWLKQQALARLDPSERRKKEQVDAAQREVLALRDAMWSRLGALAGTPDARLDEQRTALQQRVERMSNRVEWNRRERQLVARSADEHPAATAADTWWRRAWRATVDTLTTPPHREMGDAVVVREELEYHPLLENVPLDVAAHIEAHPEDYPGLKVETSTTRIYPQKALAPHIVGSRLPLSDEDLTARREAALDTTGLREGDRVGRTGVEKSYDDALRGVRGQRRIVRNRRGEIVASEVVREPRLGRDVVLTLHLDLQERLEKLLDGATAAQESAPAREDSKDEPASDEPPSDGPEDGEPAPRPPSGGCIVAIDVHTGAVLAAASAPRFDLDLLVHPDAERWKQLVNDPRHPFFDRATRMALPPGSVFKALSAVAFLESGQIHPDDMVPCVGFLDSPNRYRCYIYTHFGVGHGETNLADALMQSCNVYFFANARKIGPEPLVAWAERFGFGQPTGIDLPGEKGGNLPRPPAKQGAANGKAKPWYPGHTLGLAIGQADLTVTPMQIARLMAAVANGGSLVTPHVVRDATSHDADFGPSFTSYPAQPILGLHPETLHAIREGLEKVVSDRRGTGYKTVRMSQIAIAGKTGTAEVGGGRPDHAWFAGYAPADRPRIAFAVVLEHAGSGGRAAGPVAKELVQSLLDLGLLQPAQVTRHEK